MTRLSHFNHALKDAWFSFMAQLCLLLGKLHSAIDFYRKVVAIRSSYCGETARETWAAQTELARLLCSGTRSEAEESKQILASVKQKIADRLGPDAPSFDLARVLAVEGYLAHRAGSLAQAEMLCRESHLKFISCAPVSLAHAEALEVLADVYAAQGNKAAELRWRHRAESIRQMYAARKMRRRYV